MGQCCASIRGLDEALSKKKRRDQTYEKEVRRAIDGTLRSKNRTRDDTPDLDDHERHSEDSYLDIEENENAHNHPNAVSASEILRSCSSDLDSGQLFGSSEVAHSNVAGYNPGYIKESTSSASSAASSKSSSAKQNARAQTNIPRKQHLHGKGAINEA